MNRRDFLRRLTIGGIAATTAVREWPFRVFSFPQELKIAKTFPIDIALPPEVRVRFIRAFDPAQSKMVNRWDVLYGFQKVMSMNYVDEISEIHIATPKEARKLGLVDDRMFKMIEESSFTLEQSDSDFEASAIAPPHRWLERWESEKS